MLKSDLPFGSEFSPNQVDLPTVLDLVVQHTSDKEGFEKAIKETFFKANKTTERNKHYTNFQAKKLDE